MRRRVSGVFLWLLAAVAAGNTQGTDHPRVLVAEHPTDKRILPCRAGTDFEAAKYTIKSTTVDDPFKFLYWIGGKRGNIEAQLKEKLDKQPFRYQLVDGDALGVIEKARFTPDTKGSFAISVEVVSVENCDTFAKTLDLVYRIYSTDPPRPIAGRLNPRPSPKELRKRPPASIRPEAPSTLFQRVATTGRMTSLAAVNFDMRPGPGECIYWTRWLSRGKAPRRCIRSRCAEWFGGLSGLDQSCRLANQLHQ
jgi:hypothetical protein